MNATIHRYLPPEERFERQFVPEPMSGCWLWIGPLQRGYGSISIGGRHVKAHRWAYERFCCEVPAGLELDHLCRNKSCVNPDHLEAVTHSVNIARSDSPAKGRAFNLAKTHCPAGHPYSGDNLYVRPNGVRECRICKRLSCNASEKRRRVANANARAGS